MRALLEDFRSILFDEDMRVARAIVALGSLTWAGHLLLDDDQFARPAYVWLVRFAPQWAFGAAFLTVGVVQMWRALRRVPATAGFYACVLSGLTAWLWCAVVVAMWAAYDPPPAMSSGNEAIAIVAGIIFIRTIARRP